MNTEVAEIPLSKELEILRPEIEKVLPSHVTADKFMRVVYTSIAQNPDLRAADRKSLLTSAITCATDGLVPDGREAAFVIFNTKIKGTKPERWIKKVQYMPMVYGILKKIRQSGGISAIAANVIYEKDHFRYWVDDTGEHLLHEPAILAPDRGKVLGVYALAKATDGSACIETMSHAQVEQIRDVSKAKDSGPWVDWWDEMARKSALRRLSKRLPMSVDIETVIRRDDELYDLTKPTTAALSGREAAKSLLGITKATSEVDRPPPPKAEEEEEVDPIKVAINALRECGDLESLEEQWKSIFSDYEGKVPIDIEAVWHERTEMLEEMGPGS